MANPLLSELLSMTLPPVEQPTTKVTYADQVWEFRTMLPERAEHWRDTKLPLGTLGTAAAITGSPVGEIVAALVSINGRPLAAYLSEDLEAVLNPVKEALKKNQRSLTEEETRWMTEATTMDLFYDFMSTHYPREFVLGLYEKYVQEVRDPAKKKLSDFFGSLQETSGTPASQESTENS